MPFDKNQSLAVNTVGTNILVSASAGAGKTGVLVSRLIKRCLVDHVSLDEILAVTFTAAAAGEMKNRVAFRLQEEYQKDDSDREWIEKQMVLLATANITTIDAFCKTIIEKYYNVIGLDPAMPKNILDDGRKQILFSNALHKAIEIIDSQHHQDLLNVLEYLSVRSEDYDSLQTIINKIITVSEGTDDCEAWLRHAYSSLSVDICMHDEEIRNHFLAQLKIHMLSLQNSLSSMKSYAVLDEKLSLKIDEITKVENRLSFVMSALEDNDYEQFVDRLITASLDFKTPSNGKNIEYTAVRKKFTDTLKVLSKNLYDLQTYKEDSKDIQPIAKTLLDIVCLTASLFEEEKKKEVCMDFSDMEKYAYQILTKDNFAISKIYQNTFKEVMVDEFQDTSTLQNEIIKLLAKQGTIFRVGDVKQSIYRFRQAKPDLMRSLFTEENEKTIVLEHNYRSKDTIVKFCNALFSRVMNIDGCKDTYDEKDTVTVGTERQIVKEPNPVEFILVEQDQEEKIPLKQAKAFYIANKIKELHEEGIPYKDFCVLVRSHSDKPTLRYAFDLFQIPYDIDAREGFFKTSLCQTIYSLLKAIVNPEDVLSLLAVASSQLYGLNDTELSNLKIQYGSFYKGLKETHSDIFKDLKDFKEIADNNGIVALLTAISQKNDFYNRLTSKDQANFDFLFEKTITLEKNYHSIYDLLDFMEASEDEKSTEAMSKNKDDDVVTVTTIHQSKGLQYKIVFLWSTSQNKQMDFSSPILVDETLGFGFNHIDKPYRTVRPTMVRLAIEHKANIEDLEEFNRLLYVALTRAEEKLYIVDNAEKKVPYEENYNIASLNSRKGMTGLILSAMKEIPDLFVINHVYLNDFSLNKSQYAQEKAVLPTFTLDVPVSDLPVRPSEKETSKLPALTSKMHQGTAYGTSIHEIFEKLPLRTWTTDDLDIYQIPQKTKEQILNFSHSDLYQKGLTMTIHKEYPFFVKNGSSYIQGIIDFLAMNDTEVILIDYKTDNASLEAIANMYHEQILTYKKALTMLYPDKTISTYIYSLSNQEFIEI